MPAYDALARSEAMKAESRKNYQASRTPAPTFKLPSGRTQPIEPSNKQVESIRRNTTQQQWESRQSRTTDFYRSTPPTRVVYYEDRFHPSLNYWLAAQSNAVVLDFYWHHRAEMDARRIADLQAALGQSRYDQLRFQIDNRLTTGHKTDTTYLPAGDDYDVLYRDEYVE